MTERGMRLEQTRASLRVLCYIIIFILGCLLSLDAADFDITVARGQNAYGRNMDA